jgi:hypothetical protein
MLDVEGGYNPLVKVRLELYARFVETLTCSLRILCLTQQGSSLRC